MTTALRQLRDAVATAASQYTRLVLVVGDHGSGKSALLQSYANGASVSSLRMNTEIARGLLDIPSRQRPAAAADLAADLIRTSADGEVVVLDNIEILFLPELKLDPLKLLQDAARNRVVVAAWPGSSTHESLQFGRPPHPEARSYSHPDSLLVAI